MRQNLKTINHNLIPKEVSRVTKTLEKAGFEAYLVGGCVRDLLMDKEPKDWDITTNAKPEEIIPLFKKTVYKNNFGTVGVVVSSGILRGDGVFRETMEKEIVEVTPYRIEGKYSDFRRPDEVIFSDKLEDDLKRRDFTINAMALDSKGHITDMFNGLKDIKDKILRTVGMADDRLKEDALRMLRAVRFSVQLGFGVSHETGESILVNSGLIREISAERIQDELVKIIMSNSPSTGIVMLHKFGLLKHIIPELEEGIGCEQSGEHIYDVWNHLLHALQHAADKNWPLEIRLSALLHDIGKPRSRRSITAVPTKNSRAFALGDIRTGNPRRLEFLSGRPSMQERSLHKKFTFYGHEVASAKMAEKILARLKFPKKETELVRKFVRNHMFFSDPEKITLSAVRRIITKVGVENIWDLMKVRECDRVGMKKKETPYRLRKYFALIEEVLHDPISVGQLKIDGNILMRDIGMKPGPRIGWILHALLEEVLNDPAKNTELHLLELAKSLNLLPDDSLKTLGERGKEKKEELEEEEIRKFHSKHGVD